MTIRVVPLALVGVAGIAAAGMMSDAGPLLSIGKHTKTVSSPGPQAERTVKVGTFDKIEVSGPYEVIVAAEGEAGVVQASGGSHLLDNTDILVENGVLKIRPRKADGWTIRIRDAGVAKITLSAADLEGGSVAGSGQLTIARVTRDFDGEVAGSGTLQLGDVTATKLKLSIAGSGDIRAVGRTEQLETEIAGSGDIDVTGLVARRADIEIAGSGDTNANVTERAKVSIAGSGDVQVLGGASCAVDKVGSGTVSCGSDARSATVDAKATVRADASPPSPPSPPAAPGAPDEPAEPTEN